MALLYGSEVGVSEFVEVPDVCVYDSETGILYQGAHDGGDEFFSHMMAEVGAFLDPSIPADEDLKVGDRLRFTEWRGDDSAKLDGKIVEIVSVGNPGSFPVRGRWEHLKKSHPGRECYLLDSMRSHTGVRCWERVK